MNTKNILIISVNIINCFCMQYVFAGATYDQMLQTGKLMRSACQPKYPKITTELADEISHGRIPDDKDVKCYINCILEIMQMVKKGKFLYESTMKQIEMLVQDELVEEYLAGATACKDAAKGIKNNCDASYTLLICFRGQISKFLFP